MNLEKRLLLYTCLSYLKGNNSDIYVDQAPEAFSKHFLSITDILKTDNSDFHSDISLLKTSFPTRFPTMPTFSITQAELITTIALLNSKNVSGFDGLSSKIIVT
jgi:hypothetical protein